MRRIMYSWYSWLFIWVLAMYNMINGTELQQKLGAALIVLLALIILTRRSA